jgi:glycosyltransferase involved in cell wall biosynthesis
MKARAALALIVKCYIWISRVKLLTKNGGCFCLMDKLVTTLTPVYNCEKYIERSMKSIINQTYSNLEIIWVDDASTDSTWKILCDLFNEIQDERIILVRLNRNVGRYRADNLALSIASGDYICINNADDFSVLDRIEKSLDFLIEEDADIVGGHISVLDEEGRVLEGKELKRRRHYYWAFQPPFNVNDWLADNPYKHALFHTTMFLSRRVFDKLGGFDNTRIGGDTEFISRASFCFRIRNSSEVYTLKTLRADSLTGSPLTGITSPARRKYKLFRDSQQRKRLEYFTEFGCLPNELLYKEPSTSRISISEKVTIECTR